MVPSQVALWGVWGFIPPLLTVLLFLVGLFLILVVLIQKGKGGGLAGAFGGVGGSSAFGSRAGDLFTRITIGFAAVWICLTMFQVWVMQKAGSQAKINAVGVPGASRSNSPSPADQSAPK